MKRRNRQNRMDEFLHWIGYDNWSHRLPYIISFLITLVAVIAFAGAAAMIGLVFRYATYT